MRVISLFCFEPRILVILCTISCLCGAARCEVAVYPQIGIPVIAESVVEEGDRLVLHVYRSFTMKVPKAQAIKIDDRAASYSEFTAPAAPRTAGPNPPSALAPERQAEINSLIVSYFAAGADKARIIQEIKQHDAIAWTDVAPLSKLVFAEARKGLKVEEGDHVFAHPDFKGQVHIEIVRAKDANENLPAFLILHGGGEGVGDWKSGGPDFIKLALKKLGKGIFVCPTVLHKRYAEWGGNPDEEVFCKELLKAVKRTWPVDTNQVYLGGYSMGGYGTWHTGGHEADVFAGLVAGAGGILIGAGRGESWGWGTIGNLTHLPIAFLHGTNDRQAPVWSDQAAHSVLEELAKDNPGCYQHKYIEYAGGDHNAPFAHLGEAIPWALGFKRDPCPRQLVWEPSRACDRHFYWLKVDQPRFFTRLEAERKGNEIRLKTTRLGSGFSVLLNEQMIASDKPVTVVINGAKAFEGKVYPSLSAMVESIDDKIDESMWYSVRIDF